MASTLYDHTQNVVDYDSSKLEKIIASLPIKVSKVEEVNWSARNIVRVINDNLSRKYVLKVAVKPFRFDRLKREVSLVRYISQNSPDIPVAGIIDTNIDSLIENDYPYVLYTFLSGKNVVDIENLDESEQVEFAKQLANLTKNLHSISLTELGSVEKYYLDNLTWREYLDKTINEGLIEVEKFGSKELRGKLEEYMNNLIHGIEIQNEETLLHKDLQPQNLNWDKDNMKLSGIFDFESAMIGDHHLDFTYLERKFFVTYPKIKQLFYKEYKDLGGKLHENYEVIIKYYEFIRDLYYIKNQQKFGEMDRVMKNIEWFKYRINFAS